MALQIFGTKKCQNTRKAERYFKERNISFHFIDLNEKGLSKGELESISQSIGKDKLIDRESKEFEKSQLKYMAFDPIEEIIKNPLLLKTPIVREGKKAVNGLREDIWIEWTTKS